MITGVALVVVSVTMLILPTFLVFPSLIEKFFGIVWLGISYGVEKMMIALAALGGAGLVGGIWIIKNSN
jgi:hypothetical protein